jgi:hypothetical protein
MKKQKEKKRKIAAIFIDVKDLKILSLTPEEISKGLFLWKNKKYKRL